MSRYEGLKREEEMAVESAVNSCISSGSSKDIGTVLGTGLN